MISLFIAFAVLIIGYFVYSRVTEKIFATDDRETPATLINDGVDCVPMKTWKAFLVQLLNIAGTGPIFGALMGGVFGPVVFLWIVLGSILGGASRDVHVGGQYDVHTDGKRGIAPVDKHSVSRRHRLCRRSFRCLRRALGEI